VYTFVCAHMYTGTVQSVMSIAHSSLFFVLLHVMLRLFKTVLAHAALQLWELLLLLLLIAAL
jgi:hypothetical protein